MTTAQSPDLSVEDIIASTRGKCWEDPGAVTAMHLAYKAGRDTLLTQLEALQKERDEAIEERQAGNVNQRRYLRMAAEMQREITALQKERDEAREASKRALAVFDWLAENAPDCLGWEPPFPSTTPSIAAEAAILRATLKEQSDVE